MIYYTITATDKSSNVANVVVTEGPGSMYYAEYVSPEELERIQKGIMALVPKEGTPVEVDNARNDTDAAERHQLHRLD